MNVMYKTFDQLSHKDIIIKNLSREDTFRRLTPMQNKLYKKVLYGLKGLTPKEMSSLSEKEKLQIKNLHIKTQHVLNIWKQECIIAVSNYAIELLYQNKTLNQWFKQNVECDSNYICRTKFSELRITRTMIIKKLMDSKILPDNFSDL